MRDARQDKRSILLYLSDNINYRRATHSTIPSIRRALGIIGDKNAYVLTLVDELARDGLVHTRQMTNSGPKYGILIQITAKGLENVSSPIVNYDGPDKIDSSSWTGLRTDFEITQDKAVSIVRYLDELEIRLQALDISQEVRAQARAFVIASRTLAEAPQPPAEMIWQLLNRGAMLAGVAGLFVAVLGLFK